MSPRDHTVHNHKTVQLFKLPKKLWIPAESPTKLISHNNKKEKHTNPRGISKAVRNQSLSSDFQSILPIL